MVVELEPQAQQEAAYKFVRWAKDEEIVMEAVPDHWRGAPHVDGLTYRILTDQSAMLAAFRDGRTVDHRANGPDLQPPAGLPPQRSHHRAIGDPSWSCMTTDPLRRASVTFPFSTPAARFCSMRATPLLASSSVVSPNAARMCLRRSARA